MENPKKLNVPVVVFIKLYQTAFDFSRHEKRSFLVKYTDTIANVPSVRYPEKRWSEFPQRGTLER